MEKYPYLAGRFLNIIYLVVLWQIFVLCSHFVLLLAGRLNENKQAACFLLNKIKPNLLYSGLKLIKYLIRAKTCLLV